ncbi:MAG: ADP-ribosylglycohydrolase family protein [Thermoplasmata archaeon]
MGTSKTNKKTSKKSKKTSKKSGQFMPRMLSYIEEFSEARMKIFDILIEKYKMSKEMATEVEYLIHDRVFSDMREKYIYKDIKLLKYIIYGDPRYTRVPENLADDLIEDLDANSWATRAIMIPIYQSLGDTIGYKNGEWEFNRGEPNIGPEYTNELIYEFISLGGINDLDISNWLASDDTILYLATLKVLLNEPRNVQDFGKQLREAYLDTIPILENRFKRRSPGTTIMNSLYIQKNISWDKLPYNSRDIGAGSAMRSGCIGIIFPGRHNREKLISYAVECSRITHNSAIAILGSVTSALFTAYGLEGTPVNLWPHKLIKLLKSGIVDKYIEKTRPHEYHLFARDKVIFLGQWEYYISFRFTGLTPRLDLKNMKNPVMRYRYLSENFSKGHLDFPGSCGDDAVIMAYDALLEGGNVIEKVIVYSILHPGDSDTVGSICLSWFGTIYHSIRYYLLLENLMMSLEFESEINRLMRSPESFRKWRKIYTYDIYLHHAVKYLKKELWKKAPSGVKLS